jgi:hypothetical protein
MKKYIDNWCEGVHDLITQYVVIFLERPPADLSLEDLHMLCSLLPACTTQLLLRLLDVLCLALPQFPNMPALMVLLSQLMYCATLFARLRFDFHTLLSLLFEDTVCACISSKFSKVVKVVMCTPEMGCAAVGASQVDMHEAMVPHLCISGIK